jgi:hypothetical protein
MLSPVRLESNKRVESLHDKMVRERRISPGHQSLFHSSTQTRIWVAKVDYFASCEVLDIIGLPAGTWIFYFGVDTNIDGILDDALIVGFCCY